jgi:hypothetical protein
MPKCNHRQLEKDPEEFNWRYKSLGLRHPTCRECISGHQKKYFSGDAHDRHLQQVKDRKHAVRDVAREFVLDYLSTHPCSQCGETDSRVLEFHHEHSKEYPVSAMINGGYPIKRIQAEIEKCIVLCANCHRKLTMDERGWYKGRK